LNLPAKNISRLLLQIRLFLLQGTYGDVVSMKQQCQKVVIQFITKLEGMFLAQNLMDALRVIYLQYWLQPKLEKRFNVG